MQENQRLAGHRRRPLVLAGLAVAVALALAAESPATASRAAPRPADAQAEAVHQFAASRLLRDSGLVTPLAPRQVQVPPKSRCRSLIVGLRLSCRPSGPVPVQ
jgi:hypothetical protein